MTCYQRHLRGLFEELDLSYDKANRDCVHQAFVMVLHLPEGAHCPDVWQAVKDHYGPVDQDIGVLARDIAVVLGTRQGD